MSGLLIVNADDWGYDQRTTDAILDSFQAGRITSTSGMAYMADSDRAADIARRNALSVGLHINLTEPFSGLDVPPAVRDRQLRLIGHLGETSGVAPAIPDTAKLRRWIYDPRLRAEVDRAISDQLQRFVEIYGAPPTHFDGHNHVDLCPNVFLSSAIPPGSKLRNSLYRFPVVRSAPGIVRAARQAWRSRRFASPRYLFHIKELSLGGDSPDSKLELADRVPVEVMAHPGFAAEDELLRSAAWERALRGRTLGSFADLAAEPSSLAESFRLLPPGMAAA